MQKLVNLAAMILAVRLARHSDHCIVFGGKMIEQHRILKQHANAAFFRQHPIRDLPEQCNRTGARRDEPGNHAEKGRFAVTR
jgi:hypothetical protein